VLHDVQHHRFTDVPVQIDDADLEVERVLVVIIVEAIGERSLRLETGMPFGTAVYRFAGVSPPAIVRM